MTRIQTPADIEYPETDGEPMGETDLHRNWIARLYDLMRYRYREQHVYVGSDLLLYFEEGNPRKFVVPDIFVVKESDPGMRRTFRIWDEGRVPDVVFEVTSKATRSNDEVFKPKAYAHIGVRELFLYDPTGDYLKTRLQGYRLGDGEYMRIEPDAAGRLDCEELGFQLSISDGDLILHDSETNAVLQTPAEAYFAESEARRVEAEANLAEAEAQRADAEAQRVEALAQRAEAEAQRAEALAQRADAEAQRVKAEAQRADAEAQRAEARAQRAEADSLRAEAEAERSAREAADAEIRRLKEELQRLRDAE